MGSWFGGRFLGGHSAGNLPDGGAARKGGTTKAAAQDLRFLFYAAYAGPFLLTFPLWFSFLPPFPTFYEPSSRLSLDLGP